MTRPSQPHAQPKVHEDQPRPLRIQTVEAARRALEEHLAQCPGSYLECCGDPFKERARQKWVDDHQTLRDALELAEGNAAQVWRPAPSIQEMNPMPKKTAPEKLQTLLDRLERNLAANNRTAASTTRSEIRAFCDKEGLPCPPMAPSTGGRPKAQPEPVPAPVEPLSEQRPLEASPHVAPEAMAIIQAGAELALSRRARQMLEQGTELLQEVVKASSHSRAHALRDLGNLDALMHLTAQFAATGCMEVMS